MMNLPTRTLVLASLLLAPAVLPAAPSDAASNGCAVLPKIVWRDAGKTGEVVLPENGTAQVGGAEWSCSTSWTPVSGRAGCWDGASTFTLRKGEMKGAAAEVACEFS